MALNAFLGYVEVLDFPENAASDYANIRADLKTHGRMIRANDLFIAAHARSLRLTLVTNTDEFRRVLLSMVALAGATCIANLFWNKGFSWGRHSMRRAGLLWLAVATPLALATVWIDDEDTAAKLLASAGVLAAVAALGGLLWNDRFNPLRNVVRAGWIAWLGLSAGLTIWALWTDDDSLWFHVWASSWVIPRTRVSPCTTPDFSNR